METEAATVLLFPELSVHVRTDGMYKMTWISRGIKDHKTRIPRILYLIKDHDKGIHSEFGEFCIYNK